MKITKDKVVSIEYRMVDQAGNLIDSSDHAEPLSFIQGRAKLLPAVEEKVVGHGVGERLTFTLEPEQAYGERDDDLMRVISRDRFVHHEELRVGMTFTSGRAGHQRLVTLVDLNDDKITVDANHPLAGQRLKVDLVIIDVREALEDELATGVVQEMADIYAREQEQARIQGVPVKGPK
ncbi:MAG: peptidylprolyl isomerase [Pseudomonadota bacterium]